MTIKFSRPVGTPADIKELEYISALHQTCMPSLRQDASIEAIDIVYLLSSRHGILVDVETVKREILVEMAGELQKEPSYKLDLCQVVSFLLIPHLLKNGIDGQALSKVLDVMISDTTSLKLNRETLKTLLHFHGENADSVSDIVLDEMIQVAGGEGTMLDTTSLLSAVTSDIQLYGVDWQERFTTHYQDVDSANEGTMYDKKEKTQSTTLTTSAPDDGATGDGDEEIPSTALEKIPLIHTYTAPAIDQVADTYRSQSFTVVLWMTVVLVYISYFWSPKFRAKWGGIDCGSLSEFWCEIFNGITAWLVIFVELSVFGTTYIFLGSAGNAIYDGRRRIAVGRLLVGMTTVLFATILSLAYVVQTEVFTTLKKQRFEATYYTAALLGAVLIVLQLIALLRLFFNVDFLKRHKLLEIILKPGIEKMERRTKVAAQRKVSLMVENALSHHGRPSATLSTSLSVDLGMTARGMALLNFQTATEETENVGGLLWGWKRVWDMSICDQEGVWIHSRLVASTAMQLFVCLFLIVFWAYLILEGLAAAQSGGGESENPEEEEIEPSSVSVAVWEVVLAGSAGVIGGLVACFAIAIIYIPSFISSVLKYRSGVFPSLRDEEFRMYRFAPDQVTYVYACSFYGCLATGLVSTLLIGGVVFIAVWNETRSFMLKILAQLIGIGVTMGVKIVILCLLRHQFQAAFYRKRPLQDNFMYVILESWNLGLCTASILVRTCKLLLITAFYLGRLDTPLLAPGVGFFGKVALDGSPIGFKKDLLQHEAHRHPYIERIATVYLMKLKYGSEFGRRANSCWRLLFVLCLMPWMRKYRIRAIPIEGLDLEIKQAEAELDTEELEQLVISPPERRLKREDTKRKLERMKNMRRMQQLEGVTSREELLEREVTVLRERIRQLMDEVEDLRGEASSGVTPKGGGGTKSSQSLASLESSQAFFDAEEDQVEREAADGN